MGHQNSKLSALIAGWWHSLVVSNNSIPSHHSLRYLDCHTVPHGAGWRYSCDGLELGAQVGRKPPRRLPSSLGCLVGLGTGGSSPAGETLWHGGSWCREQSWNHRVSSTTFCCQSKSQGYSRFRGRKIKLRVLVEKAECNTGEDGMTAPFAVFLSKLNVNPMNYVQLNDTLDTEMLPSWYLCVCVRALGIVRINNEISSASVSEGPDSK